MCSFDNVDKNIEKIGKLFPNCLTEKINESGEVESVIDFDRLKQELSKEIVEGNEERYQFTWPDKKKAELLANFPITKTLRPYKEESIDFDNTENLYIEGDNLEALKLLQETYLGKIKMIYIDPPYNTGSDFVYNDKFNKLAEEYKEISGDYDDEGNRLVQNLETNGRFHTDWLNMIYPRLKVAQNLLSDDGVIFISIDDNEINNLRKICDEVFGERNFINQVVWVRNSSGKTVTKQLTVNIEYLLIYGKSNNYSFSPIYKPLSEATIKMYSKNDNDGRGKYRLYPLQKTSSPGPETTYDYIDNDGKIWKCPAKGWRMRESKLRELENDGRLCKDNVSLSEKAYWNERDSSGKLADTLWDDMPENSVGTKEVSSLFNGNVVFSNPKPIEYLMRMLDMQTSNSNKDIVLDFFSGSSSMAHAVMRQNSKDNGNRKFIMIQLPEELEEKSEAYKKGYRTICDIGKKRIIEAGKELKEKHPDLDTGFRVLKIDSSNMEDVYYQPKDVVKSLLDMMTDNIKTDRTPEDLLFQVMLDLGVSLSSKIEKITIDKKEVFIVANGYLIACFDKNITEEIIKKIALKKPYYFIMRDSSMANDNVATNFEQIFATCSPDTIKKVL